jgi:RNA recognition motif-containing protein
MYSYAHKMFLDIDRFSSVVHFYVALTVWFRFSEEFLSVYVGNLSPSTSVFDLEKVFQAFGRIKPDGVAIRSRKVSCLLLISLIFTFLRYCLPNSSTDMQEAGVFFGFVEFEDMSGIQNALSVSFP